MVERACALADGDTVRLRDLPDYVARGGAPVLRAPGPDGAPALEGTEHLPLREAKERWMSVLEASYLRTLLGRHRGNISAAAKAAGIDRKTFHRLLNKHRIRAPRERAEQPGGARPEESQAGVS